VYDKSDGDGGCRSAGVGTGGTTERAPPWRCHHSVVYRCRSGASGLLTGRGSASRREAGRRADPRARPSYDRGLNGCGSQTRAPGIRSSPTTRRWCAHANRGLMLPLEHGERLCHCLGQDESQFLAGGRPWNAIRDGGACGRLHSWLWSGGAVACPPATSGSSGRSDPRRADCRACACQSAFCRECSRDHNAGSRGGFEQNFRRRDPGSAEFNGVDGDRRFLAGYAVPE